MIYYTHVDSLGNIVAAMITSDPSSYPIPDDHRLVKDEPPNPPQYEPGVTRPLRVEPVRPDSDCVQYIIIKQKV